MSDKKFLILIILAAGAYVYFYGLPQRPTQATGGNPFTPATAVYTIDTSQPATVITATPGSLTNFAVIGGSEPRIVNSAPILPTAAPVVEYESVIDYAEMIAEPEPTRRPLSDEQLLACLSAQQQGRRMAPYCPTNAGELLGEGR